MSDGPNRELRRVGRVSAAADGGQQIDVEKR
jgi:hypothetical protein